MRLLRRRPAERWTPWTPREGELPSVGVITMARDEGDMVRRFVAHYGREVGPENVVVVDDNSSDGSTDDLPSPVLRVPPLRKRGFEPSRMGLISGLAAGLLEAYDAVLFADVDEFVVADPDRHASLRHFVATRPGRRALGVLGLNVLHDVAREPDLHEGEPILGQRRFAKFLPLMCKPALKWDPAPWAHASHGVLCPFEVDPELFMFHMKFADRKHLQDIASLRHALNASEGRAAGTSWERPADEIVAVLEQAAEGIDPARAAEFDPAAEELGAIVKRRGPMWRATGKGQVPAMRQRPVVRVPERFVGLL